VFTKGKVVFLLGAILVALCIIMIILKSQPTANIALAKKNESLAIELRSEFDAWYASIRKIPASENGAIPILNALQSLEPLPARIKILISDSLELKKSKGKDLRDYLARNEKPLTQIIDSLKYNEFSYPIDYRQANAESLNDLFKVGKAALAIIAKADLLSLDGKNLEALQEYINAIRLGMTLSSDKLLGAHIVANAVFFNALEKLIILLSEKFFTEVELTSILDQMLHIYDKCKEQIELNTILQNDLMLYYKIVVDSIDQEHSIEWIRSGGILPESKQENTPDIEPAKYVHDFENEVNELQKLKKLFSLAQEKGFPSIRRELTHLSTARYVNGFWIRDKNLPVIVDIASIANNLKKYALVDTFWRATNIIIAIKLYKMQIGHLPTTLDKITKLIPKEMLVDPFSGENFIYKLKDNGFCFFSVGEDGINNNCEDTREPLEILSNEREQDDIIFFLPVSGNK